VARVNRLTCEKRVGHGGTLDPLASGVLPVFLGQATRLVEYLQEYPKTYRAGVMLGVTTNTDDAEGEVIRRVDLTSQLTTQSSKLFSAIETILPSFLSTISQIPPAFSALKRDGRPLYQLAREGIAPKIAPRQVTIYRLEILDFQPPFLTLYVECSKGTYIRSLARDIGEKLGTGACLASLVRTAYGPFDIKQSFTPEQLESAIVGGRVEALLQPVDSVLSTWLPVMLDAAQEQAVRAGKQISIAFSGTRQSEGSPAGHPFSSTLLQECDDKESPDPSRSEPRARTSNRLRAYGASGRLVALLSLDAATGFWQPQKVFN
jgi:tRNA pseudouridine55 synthase